MVEFVNAIGWSEVGDPTSQSDEELRAKLAPLEPNYVSGAFNILRRFYHEITPGDLVVARRGTKKLVGIGTVTKRAFYDPAMGQQRVGMSDVDKAYANFIGVDWRDRSEITFDRITFAMQTMYEISEEKFGQITDQQPSLPSDADPYEFVMEKYLREFIVSNFQRVFGSGLELIGELYPAGDAGEMDILAQSTSDRSFLVIELKKGRESDKVVGQLLRYMGWAQENLCVDNQAVRGLIICREHDAKLEYALRIVPQVAVQKYRVNFELFSG